MALYMYQGTYTAESVAAQIKEPHDPWGRKWAAFVLEICVRFSTA